MKKILIAAMSALTLVACNSSQQPYVIEGSFDLPESYQLGDTIITLDPPAGYVFLCSLDGTPIDSALIEEGKFQFTGIADAKQPYFAYLMSEYAAGMFAIEPGNMTAVVTEPLRVSGTPTNDAIVALMDRVDEIGIEMYNAMAELQEGTSAQPLTEEDVYPIYEKYSNMVNHMVDSLYEANTENLMGVYCANVMTVQAQTVEELDQLLKRFSQYVKDSELIQQHYKLLRESPSDHGEDYFGN